jgi:hypothetical protein
MRGPKAGTTIRLGLRRRVTGRLSWQPRHLHARARSFGAKVAFHYDAFVGFPWPLDPIFQLAVPLGQLLGSVAAPAVWSAHRWPDTSIIMLVSRMSACGPTQPYRPRLDKSGVEGKAACYWLISVCLMSAIPRRDGVLDSC